MVNLVIKITKLKNNAIIPEYQTKYAAGMDLHACLERSVSIKPLERTIVPTGLAIELPRGYEAQIRARSGLSIKYGITTINGVGTIDSDYRGEIGILIVNLGTELFSIEPDMRIAQMIISKYECVSWKEVKFLNQTERGAGAYNSTGTKA